METMQFDEKDSLSAMAFVVAGQQKTIITLQEDVKHWRDEYKEASDNFSSERTENIALRDEIKVQAKKYEDRLEIMRIQSEQRQNEVKEIKDKYNGLYDENCKLCENITTLEKRLLQWHSADESFPKLKVEDHPTTPCCLLLIETVKEGAWTNNNHPIPLGTREIIPTYLQLDQGVYRLDFKDSLVEIIAWCIVGLENYREP